MENGIKIPAGLQTIFNLTKSLDEDRQAQVLRSASIFVYGCISGCKSGYDAGYKKAMKEGKKMATA